MLFSVQSKLNQMNWTYVIQIKTELKLLYFPNLHPNVIICDFIIKFQYLWTKKFKSNCHIMIFWQTYKFFIIWKKYFFVWFGLQFTKLATDLNLNVCPSTWTKLKWLNRKSKHTKFLMQFSLGFLVETYDEHPLFWATHNVASQPCQLTLPSH